jgi:hypothetical protein
MHSPGTGRQSAYIRQVTVERFKFGCDSRWNRRYLLWTGLISPEHIEKMPKGRSDIDSRAPTPRCTSTMGQMLVKEPID